MILLAGIDSHYVLTGTDRAFCGGVRPALKLCWLLLLAAPACADSVVGSQSQSIRAGSLEHGTPSAVALRDRTGAPFCSGVLIAADVVLTAAHCVDVIGDGVEVVFGDDALAETAVTRTGVRWAVDPRWDGDHRQGHDIGLIRLDRPADEAPASLTASVALPVKGTNLRLVAFGVDPLDSERFFRKQSASLTVGFVGEKVVFFDHRDAAQICEGDSGAPLFAGDSGDESVVAVASFGDVACAASSGASPLATSLDFIETWIAEGSTSACEHDVCEKGTALPASCDPCVARVCEQDGFCCQDTWDRGCVERAALECSNVCDGKEDALADDAAQGGCSTAPQNKAGLLWLLLVGVFSRRRHAR